MSFLSPAICKEAAQCWLQTQGNTAYTTIVHDSIINQDSDMCIWVNPLQGNVRIYYQQYEAQQNQYLIDQKVKEHLGQAAAFQQIGAAYNQLRPRLPVLPNPMMHMPGMNPSLMPGMRPPISLPRPMPGK